MIWLQPQSTSPLTGDLVGIPSKRLHICHKIQVGELYMLRSDFLDLFVFLETNGVMSNKGVCITELTSHVLFVVILLHKACFGKADAAAPKFGNEALCIQRIHIRIKIHILCVFEVITSQNCEKLPRFQYDIKYPQEALCSLLHLRNWTDAQDLDDDCNGEFLGENGVVVAAPIHKTTQLLAWTCSGIGPDWSR